MPYCRWMCRLLTVPHWMAVQFKLLCILLVYLFTRRGCHTVVGCAGCWKHHTEMAVQNKPLCILLIHLITRRGCHTVVGCAGWWIRHSAYSTSLIIWLIHFICRWCHTVIGCAGCWQYPTEWLCSLNHCASCSFIYLHVEDAILSLDVPAADSTPLNGCAV